MKFGFFGINYKNAPLFIRDKTSFTDVRKVEFFQQAEEAKVGQCFILSTCNRSEVYFCYEEEEQFTRLREIYKEIFPDVLLDDYLVELRGEEAYFYLFQVTAGLESLVLGEDQILGQVKEALDFSRTMGYSKKEMNKIVRSAITCAKRIKTELKVSERPLSVSYIGIQRLNRACPIKGKKALVIGSGKTAVLALKYLYEYQAGHVIVCSRTHDHAKRLREDFPGLEAAPYEDRYEAMRQCEIVISATASPHLVVRRDKAVIERKTVFLDLAAPRDIDTALEKEPLARLINLDTLQEIVKENQRERERLVEESRHMIEEALEELRIWLLQSRMDGTIESLQQRCRGIVEDSYEYLNRKMDLNQREQKLLQKVLNASLQRLLREPINELKNLETREQQEEYKELVKRLFQI